jgi:hypothetical protein
MYSPGHGHVEVKESIALELCLLQSKVRRFMGQLHANLESKIFLTITCLLCLPLVTVLEFHLPDHHRICHKVWIVVASFHNLL